MKANINWKNAILLMIVIDIIIITLALLIGGCSPGQHHGQIIIHDPNRFEVIFDRPMSMEVEQGGIKVKASSMQPGFFEDIIKFLLLRPR